MNRQLNKLFVFEFTHCGDQFFGFCDAEILAVQIEPKVKRAVLISKDLLLLYRKNVEITMTLPAVFPLFISDGNLSTTDNVQIIIVTERNLLGRKQMFLKK